MIDRAEDLELADAAAEARAAWRADEAEWTRAAWESWEHERTLADVARDAMHRGDIVHVSVASRALRGVVTTVGTDFVRLATPDGVVDVRITIDAPLTFRIIGRARAGGSRNDGDVATFRARLLELETATGVVGLGVRHGEELVGTLRVGRDQVSVVDRFGDRSYVPIGSVTWVRPVDVD